MLEVQAEVSCFVYKVIMVMSDFEIRMFVLFLGIIEMYYT